MATQDTDMDPSPFLLFRVWGAVSEDDPEIILGRRTHVTRTLAPPLVRDVNAMPIQEVSRRHGLPWHFLHAADSVLV